MAHPYERAVAHVAAAAVGGPLDPGLRVTLHFHPDRLVAGRPILACMARDGRYRSQFETGVSNGGRTAYPGGDRWRWECRMFGGAYDDAPPRTRPKYGSLNFRRRRVGGSPRFGSAHLRLAAHTLTRTTFCYPDSVFEPERFGVAARASTLIEAATAADTAAATAADNRDPLDDYIEAHVHGDVDLTTDVEALVLDPCYRGTDVETAAGKLGCPVEWHPGFVLATAELRAHPEYRGAEFVDLGLALARGDRLDARVIGDAARTGRYDEQALKRVWHYVARFGGARFGVARFGVARFGGQ
jgi:hypothetical protein